ncbi:MAG: hypothetical protein KDI09_16080, partial [Halioglobus sp.]|nr:hypothetical protein [Halioglobus sp.]
PPPSQAPVPVSPAAAETGSRAVTPATETGAAPTAAGSPFDYEPSEDISEDLSVSFPVDI